MKIQRLPVYLIIRLEDDADGTVFGLADLTISAANVLVTEDLNAVQALDAQQQTLAGFQTQLTRALERITALELQNASTTA